MLFLPKYTGFAHSLHTHIFITGDVSFVDYCFAQETLLFLMSELMMMILGEVAC